MSDEDKKGSPDTGKGLENESTLPSDMGVGKELVKGGEEEIKPLPGEEEEVEKVEISEKLKGLMVKKGIKNLDEIAESLESSEQKITELTKDVRLSKLSIPPGVPRRPDALDPSTFKLPTLDKDPYSMSKEEFNTHMEKCFDTLGAQHEEIDKDRDYNQRYGEVVTLINRDPEKFQKLRPHMATLSRQ